MNRPLNLYFDHTVLKQEAQRSDIIRLCEEAREYGFYAVCVNSCYVGIAKAQLADSGVKVAAVVGFPLGACLTEVKAFEADLACKAGAQEIDMVIHVGDLLEERYEAVESDIRAVAVAAKRYGALVKVILETNLLTDQQIAKACKLAESAGAAFVKTSTGFSPGGATAHHVELMKKCVCSHLQVKASGGIRTLEDVLAMIEAGADRIGASASVQIMKEYERIQEQ